MVDALTLVRPASKRDRTKIRSIECACFGRARWLFGLWPRAGRADTWTLIAEIDGVLAGYLIAYAQAWHGADETYVGGVGVLPQQRHKGIANRLMRRTFDAHPRVWLHVRAGNVAAIALYHGLGMRDAGAIPGFYPNGDSAIVFATSNLVDGP